MADDIYSDVRMVICKGIVISLARKIGQADCDTLYYNILDLSADSARDADDWTGFKELRFPTELRPAGMALIDIPIEMTKKNTQSCTANAPFFALGEGDFVWVFRQSYQGKIWANRFRLTTKAMHGADASRTHREAQKTRPELVLEPAWEVRFRHTGRYAVSTGRHDPQSVLDPDGTPYIEPVYELPFKDDIANGRFAVALTAAPASGGRIWHFFLTLSQGDGQTGATMAHYAVPFTARTPFDLSQIAAISADHRLQPAGTFDLKTESGEPFDTKAGPSVAIYARTERLTADTSPRDGLALKRDVRLMLAQPVAATGGRAAGTAIVDFAIGRAGTLAQTPSALELPVADSSIGYCLRISNDDYIALDDKVLESVRELRNTVTVIVPVDITLKFWISVSNFCEKMKLFRPGDNDFGPSLICDRDGSLTLNYKDAAGNDHLITSMSDAISKNSWSEISIDMSFFLRGSGPLLFVSAKLSVGSRTVRPSDPKAIPGNYRGTLPEKFGPFVVGGTSEDIECLIWDLDISAHNAYHAYKGHWSLETVLQNGQTASTPGKWVGKSLGMHVHGAEPVLTERPNHGGSIDSGSEGVHIDPDGLSTEYTLLRFAQTDHAPHLLDSADGAMHLYYSGAGAREFLAGRFKTDISRAVFDASWRAGPNTTGKIDFVARRPGPLMNDATISIKAGGNGDTCCLTISAPLPGSQPEKETWRNVPRRLEDFMAVVNGQSVRRPDDQGLRAGTAIFYDPDGSHSLCRLPTDDTAGAAALEFVDRRPDLLALKMVHLTDQALSLKFGSPKWPSNKHFQQTWTLGTGDKTTTSILAALDESSATAQSTTSGTCLELRRPVEDAGPAPSSGLHAICHEKDVSLKIKVDKSPPGNGLVTVDILINGAKPIPIKLPTPLRFSDMAQKFNTNDKLSKRAVFIPFGPDRDAFFLSKGIEYSLSVVQPDTMLFSAYQSGFSGRSLRVSAASVSSYGQGVTPRPKPSAASGSMIVTCTLSTAPHNGVTATVEDSTASLKSRGGGGGWVGEPLRYGLRIPVGARNNDFADWGMNKANASLLTPERDFTIEAWINPQSRNLHGSEIQIKPLNRPRRLITASREHAIPGQPGRNYGWQLQAESVAFKPFYNVDIPLNSPNVVVALTSTLRLMFEEPDRSLRTTIYYKNVKPAVRFSSLTLQIKKGILSWNLDPAAQMAKFIPKKWYHLGFVADSASNVILLFVDGQLVGSKHIDLHLLPTSNLETYGIETLFQGGELFYSPHVNEISWWSRALSPEEIAQDAQISLPDDSNDLEERFLIDQAAIRTRSVANSTQPLLETQRLYGGGYYTIASLVFDDRRVVAYRGRGLGLPESWTHLAATCKIGTAIRCDAERWGDAGRDETLSPGEALSLEAWIRPSISAAPATVLARDGAYTVARLANGRIAATVHTSAGPVSADSGDSHIPDGALCYLAVTVKLSEYTKTVTVRGQQREKPQYRVDLSLTINEQPPSSGQIVDKDDPIRLKSTNAPLFIGRGAVDGVPFLGGIGPLRIWGRVLEDDEIRTASLTRLPPENRSGLLASWSFNEQTGRTARSSEGGVSVRLSRNDMWAVEAGTAELTLMIDGVLQDLAYESAEGHEVDHSTTRFQIGGDSLPPGGDRAPMPGLLNEVRLWSEPRTEEQIGDNMFRRLSGHEANLSGYWRMDQSAGKDIPDATGKGNNGTIYRPGGDEENLHFRHSIVPVGDEVPAVQRMPSPTEGPSPFGRIISGTPAVIEYADLQRDARGEPVSVLKRCYNAPIADATAPGNGLLTITGFKVGDLETVHVGRAQTRATLVGYIEGAPPLPSENQTQPFYESLGTYRRYDGRTSVSLSSADAVSYAFDSGTGLHHGHTVNIAAGHDLDVTVGTAAGLGFQAIVEPVKLELEGEVKFALGLTSGNEEQSALSIETTENVSDSFSPAGAWEKAHEVFNLKIGRRYVPESTGYAVVKSRTADVYASRIAGSDTALKLTLVPNMEIPPDTNLIDFPLNPSYVKTGVLDGRIGFKQDPDTAHSFFRPAEAYEVKAEAERQDSETANSFDGFNPSYYSNVPDLVSPRGYERFAAFKRQMSAPRRSIVNTYVWTDGGGFRAEEFNLADTTSETHSGMESFQFNGGFSVKFALGIAGALDYTYDQNLTVHAQKAKSDSKGFGLHAHVQPEDWLLSLDETQASGEPVFHDNPTPGTVEAYRFMALRLPPSQDNGTEFFRTVIDPGWLQGSAHPDAAALRDAAIADAGAWRVLYRTTYVGRVTMPHHNGSAPTLPLPDKPAPRAAAVAWLVKLVSRHLDAPANPMPQTLSKALEKVLHDDLKDVLPWWTVFLETARTHEDSAEARLLTSLQVQALDWMIGHWTVRVERDDS